MKLFQCDSCGQLLHFENTRCENCGCAVGFESTAMRLLTLIPVQTGFTEVNFPQGLMWTYCKNHLAGVCNWLVESTHPSGLCKACELNHYIPNLQDVDSHKGWRAIEFAKHRLIYSLLRLGLPIESKSQAPELGLSFDFINSDQVVPEDAETMTGHDNGKITIALDEADPLKREQARVNMQERYRTLLGHLRHEVGHYYWDRLIWPFPERLEGFRTLFGDETIDYEQSLDRHYTQGPPVDWNLRFISPYASSHAWEDWAETWSHYLHLMDTMETANALGVSSQPQVGNQNNGLTMRADNDPYLPIHFEAFLQKAVALTFAVNSLNRSMGQPDLYPFILNEPVKQKLTFIHEVLKGYE